MRLMAEQALLRRGWLAGQPEDFRRAVLDQCLLLPLERGMPVYHQGDPPGGIFGIAAGALAISIAPGEGGRISPISARWALGSAKALS